MAKESLIAELEQLQRPISSGDQIGDGPQVCYCNNPNKAQFLSLA